MKNPSQFVKTTISVPSEVYARATRRAKELGTSRSAFFTDAVEKELAGTDSSIGVIERINAVIKDTEGDTSEFVAFSSRRTLKRDDATRW
jgi:hypothetical protein